MKTKHKLVIAISALLLGSNAFASTTSAMKINVGSNAYEYSPFTANDADFLTGVFNNYGFNDNLATSVYDYNDTSVLGSFFDTNVISDLTPYGIPGSFTALDTVTTVALTLPAYPSNEVDINNLNPLVPPVVGGVNSEGFGLTWDLVTKYNLTGNLSATGPTYTGGYLDLYFRDISSNATSKVLGLTLTSSAISLANLDLNFNLTYAATGFLKIQNLSSGVFDDAAADILAGNLPTMQLHTNVNPPVPTASSLAKVTVGADVFAIRQSTLSGTIDAKVPEPATLALLGIGLLGFSAASRKKNA